MDDDELREFIAAMFETMYDAPGIGLAATQVDVHIRLLVTDVSAGKDQPLCLINPEIMETSGTTVSEEGCLSVPDIFANMERADQIRVKALGPDGKPLEMDADGILAVCIQHEMDHLEGKLFVDYLSELKRERIRKQLEKARRQKDGSEPAAKFDGRHPVI